MKLQVGNQYNMLPMVWQLNDPGEYVICTDKFGRQWKLEPVKSERIIMPFIVTPLPKE